MDWVYDTGMLNTWSWLLMVPGRLSGNFDELPVRLMRPSPSRQVNHGEALETPGFVPNLWGQVVAAGLQARIDLDEQPKPCLPPFVMVAMAACQGFVSQKKMVKQGN